MSQKRNQKRNEKRKKRNQEEEEEDIDVDVEGEQEEELRKGLLIKRYVCCFIIEDNSLSRFTDDSFNVDRWVKDRGWRRRQLRIWTWTGTSMRRKDQYENVLHPQFNLYKRQQEWSIYPIFTTVFWWLHLFLVLVSDWKKKSQKETLKIQVKVILTKIQQGNNLDEEPKDKYETSVHN